MLDRTHAQQGGYGPPGGPPPYGPPPGGYGPPGAPGAPPAGGYGPPVGAPPGMAPPGAGGAQPSKMNPGVKYALFGCGCLALIGAGALIFTLATGGVASYVAHKAVAPGGADCVAAAACCKKMLAKSGQTDMSSCETLKTAPAIACAQALKSYKRSAPALGITCP